MRLLSTTHCAAAAALALLIVLGACDDNLADEPFVPEDPPPATLGCGPFADWQASPYVLPYPAGKAYTVNQANCSGFGHSTFWKYGYDFLMPIGAVVTASRAGQVGWARDGCRDGNRACTNLITVLHDDGTVLVYSHLTHGGVLVE